MGYTPQIELVEKPGSVPSVAERLEELQIIRREALEKIVKAQKVMKIENPGNKRFWPYKEGKQVWIEGTNIKTIYPTVKLGPKQHGPFKILKHLSDAIYRMESCQGPSHGGSYMDEGTSRIRIGLLPYVVSGAISLLSPPLCLLCCSRAHIRCSMIRGCTSMLSPYLSMRP